MNGKSGFGEVEIYTTPWCGYCYAAKRLLTKRGVPFREIDVGQNRAARADIVAKTGWPTVPVILYRGELIGGYDELAALDRAKGLDHLRSVTNIATN